MSSYLFDQGVYPLIFFSIAKVLRLVWTITLLLFYHLRRHVSELIQSIVELISQNLSLSFTSITNDLVGIDSSVEELITSYLDLGNNVCMIGVCGMGGSGKTTLARVVYGKFRGYFEGSSFIANVREYSKKN